jgi:hypothetical protein
MALASHGNPLRQWVRLPDVGRAEWAKSARDPAVWLAKLDELERLAEHNGESAARWIDLLFE